MERQKLLHIMYVFKIRPTLEHQTEPNDVGSRYLKTDAERIFVGHQLKISLGLCTGPHFATPNLNWASVPAYYQEQIPNFIYLITQTMGSIHY